MTRRNGTDLRRTDLKKDLKKLGIAAAALFAASGALWFGISKWEDSKYKTEGGESSVYVEPVITEARTVEINGVTYEQKQNVETYLMMGIDIAGPVEKAEQAWGGGQADVQMLVVLDNKAKTWRILQLNRDSMVDVPVINEYGDVVTTNHEQLALAHGYGWGLDDSCRNVCMTVSGLLWSQPINGYTSINMDAIQIVNDAIGGVPVTIQSDYTKLDPAFVQGSEVNLMGDQAIKFIRTRIEADDGTNLARMARQRQYMSSFLKKFMTLDEETMLDILEQIKPYTVTDMESGTLAALGTKIQDYEQLELMTIDGTLEEHEYFEYYLDDDSLTETILELFYQKKEG